MDRSSYLQASRVASDADGPTAANLRFFVEYGWLIISASERASHLISEFTQKAVLPHFARADGGVFSLDEYRTRGPVLPRCTPWGCATLASQRLDELNGFPRSGLWSFGATLPQHLAHDWSWRSPTLITTLDALFGSVAPTVGPNGVDWDAARARFDAAAVGGFRDQSINLTAAPPLETHGRRWWCEPTSRGTSNRAPLAARDSATHSPATWSPQLYGWHCDGPPRALDCGAYALTMLAFGSRVEHGGGATTVQEGSHTAVLRRLRRRRLHPDDDGLIEPCCSYFPYASKPCWDCCLAELPLWCALARLQCRSRHCETNTTRAQPPLLPAPPWRARWHSSPCCAIWSLLLLVLCCAVRGSAPQRERHPLGCCCSDVGERAISELGAEAAPIEAGDIVVMHGLLRHSAAPNHREVLRVASQMHVHWMHEPSRNTDANVASAKGIANGDLELASTLDLERLAAAFAECGARSAVDALDAGALSPLEALLAAELVRRS